MKKTLVFNRISETSYEILLYGEIGWDVDDSIIINQLNRIGADCDEVTIRINSTGGDVFKGIAIFNSLRSFKAKKIMRIEGVAASMASVIAMAGDVIYINRYARLMLHRSSGFVAGDTDDFAEASRLLASIDADLTDIYSKRTGMKADEIKEKYLGRGVQSWFTAEEAIAAKLADEEYEGVCIAAKADEDMLSIVNKFTHKLIGNNMKKILAKLGLPEDATEEQAIAAIEIIQKMEDENKTLKEDKTKLEGTLKNMHTEQVTALVDGAISAKKITADMKEHYVKLATNDFETTKCIIDKMQVAPTITSLIQGKIEQQAGREGWTFEDYRQKAPADLEAMKTSDVEKYKSLFKAEYGREPKL